MVPIDREELLPHGWHKVIAFAIDRWRVELGTYLRLRLGDLQCVRLSAPSCARESHPSQIISRSSVGDAIFDVHEHHQNVGFYYIEVHFTSGNSTRIPHDGRAPNRSSQLRAHTARPNDEVRGIKVVRVRD
jgi:hypothetical protein